MPGDIAQKNPTFKLLWKIPRSLNRIHISLTIVLKLQKVYSPLEGACILQFVNHFLSVLLLSVICLSGPDWCLSLRHPAAAAAAAAAAAKSLQSCPTLCDPIDRSPPGFPIPGILQARTLGWVAISFSNAWKWKWSHSVVCPWDFPGESTGVGYHCLLLSATLEELKFSWS